MVMVTWKLGLWNTWKSENGNLKIVYFQEAFIDLDHKFLVMTWTWCMPGKQWILEIIWPKKIMVTQYQPRAMSFVLAWYNLISLILHCLVITHWTYTFLNPWALSHIIGSFGSLVASSGSSDEVEIKISAALIALTDFSVFSAFNMFFGCRYHLPSHQANPEAQVAPVNWIRSAGII